LLLLLLSVAKLASVTLSWNLNGSQPIKRK